MYLAPSYPKRKPGPSPFRLRAGSRNLSAGYAVQQDPLRRGADLLNIDRSAEDTAYQSDYTLDADDLDYRDHESADVDQSIELDTSPHETSFVASREQNKLSICVNSLVTSQAFMNTLSTSFGNSVSSPQTQRGKAEGLQKVFLMTINFADFIKGVFTDHTIANIEAILAENTACLLQNYLTSVILDASYNRGPGPRRSARVDPMTPIRAEDKAAEEGGILNSTSPSLGSDPDHELNDAAAVTKWVMDCIGKPKDITASPEGCDEIVKTLNTKLREECAIWCGVEKPDDIKGIKKKTTIQRLVNFLHVVFKTEMNRFSEYHQFADAVTDPMHVKRFKRIGISGIFQANSIRQVIAACTAEAGQIVTQLFREETNENVTRLIEEERRRNEFNSGPLGCALNIGIGFNGFGRALTETYAGKITTASINKLMTELSNIKREENESVHNMIRRFWDLFHKIQTNEQQLPESSRPFWSAIVSGQFTLEDKITQALLRTPDEDGNPRSQQEMFMLSERTREFKFYVAEITANVTSLREHDSQVEQISLNVAKSLDSEARSIRALSASGTFGVSNKENVARDITEERPRTQEKKTYAKVTRSGNKYGKDKSYKKYRGAEEGDHYANFTTTEEEAAVHHDQGDSAEPRDWDGDFQRTLGCDGRVHTVAFFDSQGGTKCAYCGCDDPTERDATGRFGVPHDKQHCMVEAYDRANGKPGEHACEEYRKIAKERGAKHMTEPTSRTKPIPSYMPIAGTAEECYKLKKTGIIPNTTKYVAPGDTAGYDKKLQKQEFVPDLATQLEKYTKEIHAMIAKQGEQTNERIDELFEATGLQDYDEEDWGGNANAAYCDEHETTMG